jgi:hypothetical protein
VVDRCCWRLAVQQRWPALAAAAEEEGGVTAGDAAAWRALYKLCAFRPSPAPLRSESRDTHGGATGCVALARAVQPVEALHTARGA